MKERPINTDHELKLLPKTLLLQIYDLMVKTRVLEERLIRIYKAGQSYFWIGGAGEEAFGVPLGLLVQKGMGLKYDWLHLHYRATPTLIAMGMEMRDSIALSMNRASDPSTGGRNFCNHYCFPKWNVAPVTSPIEVQYSIAIGTALAQSRIKDSGITIVTGGDAGTAEGDFATSLIWSSRKGTELPMLITVQNNLWGISTTYSTQHGEERISDRGKAFGMKAVTFDGNNPIESYIKLKESIDYVRKERRPCLLEAMVSRLYGHSSASGANWIDGEVDCVRTFGERLLKGGLFTESELSEISKRYDEEAKRISQDLLGEPGPGPETLWDHFYVNNENGNWREF